MESKLIYGRIANFKAKQVFKRRNSNRKKAKGELKYESNIGLLTCVLV